MWKPVLRGFVFGWILSSALIRSLYAEEPTREQILMLYEKVIHLAEDLAVHEDDMFGVVPKIRLATQYLFEDEIQKAGQLLKESVEDLSVLRTQQPTSVKRKMKVVWLELFFDMFQKFIFLMLFAYFFNRGRHFSNQMQASHFTAIGRIYLSLLIASVSILLSFIDITRYGHSAWGFFDIQIVLVTVCGLLGGLGSGILAGALVGLFRWLLSPEAAIYIFIITTAGILSGLASRRIDDFKRAMKQGFMTGALIGLIHASVIYGSFANLMPWNYFLFTIASVSFLEGAAVMLFFMVSAASLKERIRIKLEHDLLKAKLLFLQAQINPHFLFNALNTVSALCYKEKARSAQNLIVKISTLLRHTMQRVDQQVTLKEEMDYIDSYLDIQKARFRDRIHVEKKVQINRQEWGVKVPILVIQPLVENAIQHGIGQKLEGGTVSIGLSRDNGHVLVEVSDDGVGMDDETIRRIKAGDKNVSKNGNGIGVHNIEERLVHLFGKEYGLEFQGQKGIGTKVSVRIPVAAYE